MNKTLKIIISIVIILIIIIVVFLSKNKSLSSVDSTRNISNNQNASVINASIQNTPPPKDQSADSADSDIDTYLQAYRTDTQPSSTDFNDTYSDLK